MTIESVLITGASRGLGLALTKKFSEQGVRVFAPGFWARDYCRNDQGSHCRQIGHV